MTVNQLNAIGADYIDSQPPQRPTLSIVIPAYDDLARVMRLVKSLRDHAAFEHQYVVQDDCSPSVNMEACIPADFASVQRNAQNQGFVYNSNAGGVRATGDIIFFCNHDVFAVEGWSNGWDAALLNAFNDPSVGLVGARLLFPDGVIQSAGGQFDARCRPFHRCLGYSNPHYAEVSTARYISWVTGGAVGVRASLWRDIGGFDPAYVRGYFEDVAFSVEVQLRGYKVLYQPAITLIHEVGSTGGNKEWFTKNALLFKQRYVDTGIVQPDVSFLSPYANFW